MWSVKKAHKQTMVYQRAGDKRVNVCRWAAFPPAPHKLQELFELGYKDTLNWLKDNGKLTPGLLPDGALMDKQNVTIPAAQGNQPKWRNLVAQTAMDAPSCDESLKDAVAGKQSSEAQ